MRHPIPLENCFVTSENNTSIAKIQTKGPGKPRSHSLIFLFLLTVGIPLLNAAKAPNWLHEATKLATPAIANEDEPPNAVVLHDEAIYTLEADGTLIKKLRYAIRVLDTDGRKRAIAQIPFQANASKVSGFKAWAIDKEGDVYSYKGKDYQEKASSGYRVYSESRIKSLNGAYRMKVGSVFGYEYTLQERSVFAQGIWYFQTNIPVLHSKLELVLPQGWSIDEYPLSGAPQSAKTPNGYSWIMTDILPTKAEPSTPASSSPNARVMFKYIPPNGTHPKHTNLTLDSWKEIIDYTIELQDPQATPNDEIKKKAEELTSTETSNFGKIRAIGDFVRKKDYASISMDVSRGGGYTPRSAIDTFETGYGDCKDKATLMRSMLQTIGINSYPVIVNASTNNAVLPDWPSTIYFNHCILAVEVDDKVNTPAVLDDDEAGRLLFVDPTSKLTPIGNLPFDEQGGYIMIAKPGLDKLLVLPQESPQENSVARTIEAQINPDGSILGKLKNHYSGTAANKQRQFLAYNNERKIQSTYEKMVGGDNGSSVIKIIESNDNELTDRSMELELDFYLKSYGKSMRRQLLIFKPAILDRTSPPTFLIKDRTLPIVLDPKSIKEETKFYLPNNYEIDEFKKQIEIVSPFGSYTSNISQINGATLIYKRDFILNSAIVPVEQYSELHDFYSEVIKADQSAIILKKSSGRQLTQPQARL